VNAMKNALLAILKMVKSLWIHYTKGNSRREMEFKPFTETEEYFRVIEEEAGF